MARQLVVCLDGTNNRFSNRPTNVVHIFRALNRDPKAVLGYYDQGVGTFGLKETLFEWQKVPSRVFGLAFGWGLDRIVRGAYEFLAKNYRDTDDIFIFGFSRGAYAARALAALIRAVGLVASHQSNLFDYAWSMLVIRRGTIDFPLQGRFKSTFGRPARIRFLGLFDTVSSVGWIYDPVIIPYTRTNVVVDNVRHAVSIDERRCFFRQNLWSNDASKRTHLKEVWFAGVHSDIGGGYEPEDSRLSRVARRWMMCEALHCGLRFDVPRALAILGSSEEIPDDRIAPMHDSMTRGWKCAEWVPRWVWEGKDNRRNFYFGRMPPFRRLRPRVIPLNAQLHQSVLDRINRGHSYQPVNLPVSYTFVDDLVWS